MKKLISLFLALGLLLSLCACGGKTDKTPSSQDDDIADVSDDESNDESENDDSDSDNSDAADETADAPESKPEKVPDAPAEPEEPEAVELLVGEANTVDGAVEYTLVNAYSSVDVMPPKASSVYTHYQADSGKKYLVFVVDVKNLSSTNTTAEDLLSAELTIGASSYFANCIVEEDGGASFGYSNITAVASLDTARLYYLFSVPEDSDTESMVFSATANNDTRSATVGLSQFESRLKSITIGEEITDDATLSLTVDNVYFSTTLYPPQPGNYYSYYEAASGKTYLIVKMSVKNLKGSDLKYDAIAGVSYLYNERYNYSTFAVLEEDGGADLNGYPSQYAISPLDSGVVYYLSEVPAEVETGSVEITFYIAGEYYTYHLGA